MDQACTAKQDGVPLDRKNDPKGIVGHRQHYLLSGKFELHRLKFSTSLPLSK